jgi:alkylhydroperoxidase/carboxymuconolactone decarboxylase family protein YurZ
MTMTATAEHNIEAIGRGDAPVLEQLVQMTIDTRERSGLDDQTYMLVRLAALVATDAAPVSYLVNLGAARAADVEPEDIQGLLVAVAPIVGTARTVSAASKMIQALGLAESFAEDEDEDRQEDD